MPQELADHIEYADLAFDGGLWSIGDYLIPPNGAAVMNDCYPQQGGGLRAWSKPTLRSRAGIPATEAPLAIFTRGGVANRSGPASSSSDFYLVTANHTTNVARLYRWDETEVAVPITAWVLLKTFAAASVPTAGEVSFVVFKPTTPAETAVYLAFEWSGSSDEGIWRIDYDNGAVTLIESRGGIRAFTIHQDRMIYSYESSKIRYSELHEDNFTPSGLSDGAGFFDLLPDIVLTRNHWMRSFGGELMVGKQGAPILLVQGDLFDPQLRILGDTHPAGDNQFTAELPDGVVFCAFREGYFITRSGIEIAPLSPQIDPELIAGTAGVRGTHSVTLGNPQFAHPFFVTPSGHIYDFRTKAWFRTSEFGPGMSRAIGKHMTYDRHADEQKLYVCTDTEDFAILEFNFNEGLMDRKRTYTYQSPKLRHPTGRRLCVREVQVPCRVVSSGASYTVTVNGVQRQVTGLAAGYHLLRFPFNEEAEYLDIKLVPDSGSDTVEAPITEAGRVGNLPGRLVAPETIATV